MVLPKGQETELTGFFIYCTQILTWLPPLVFTLMIESGINQRWGLMSLIIFFVIAIGLFSLVAPWEDVLKESAKMIDADKIMDDVVEVTDVTEDATEDVTEEP
jgi:MFS-type transporter involved in bile tolerance (Atg22 family)